MEMKNLYYVKVSYCGENYSTDIDEIMFVAESYVEAAEKVESIYGNVLLGFSIYAFEDDVISVKEIEDMLKEARGMFND